MIVQLCFVVYVQISSWNIMLINSLWHSDVVWRGRTRSRMVKKMSCFLTVPSHPVEFIYLPYLRFLLSSPNAEEISLWILQFFKLSSLYVTMILSVRTKWHFISTLKQWYDVRIINVWTLQTILLHTFCESARNCKHFEQTLIIYRDSWIYSSEMVENQ